MHVPTQNVYQVKRIGAKSGAVVAAAISVVIGLMWRDVIFAYIDRWFGVDHSEKAKLIAVVILTLLFVSATVYYEEKNKTRSTACFE